MRHDTIVSWRSRSRTVAQVLAYLLLLVLTLLGVLPTAPFWLLYLWAGRRSLPP
jgi:uncharacterized membrane protein YbaN (DUF454 family)